jgi:hypothetical protein
VAIVFVLATVLLFVTHAAGHQLYRSNLIKRCNKEWRDDGQPGKYKTATIALDDNQNTDDNEQSYTQCVNRVGTTGSYTMVIIAVISIIFIAIASTWMRVEHLDTVTAQETSGAAIAAEPTASGNPFASVPSELSATQIQANKQATTDINKSTGQEGMAAFIMLAFIFVVTQIVGIAAGYKWGFAGKESKKAFNGIHGFSTYDDFLGFYEPIIQQAQSKLQTLQQRLAEQHSNQSLNLRENFINYLSEKRQERETHRNPENSVIKTQEITSNQAKAHISNLADKQAQMAYFTTLPPHIQEELKPWLKLRKEDELRKEEAAKMQPNLEELF